MTHTISYYRDQIIQNTIVIRLRTRISLIIYLMWFCVSGCSLDLNSGPVDQMTNSVGQITAVNDIMQGICFESAFDAAGQTFVLSDDAQLTKLFDLADNSRLCRHPVERKTFDYSSGSVLAGTWSKGIGCNARHDLVKVKVNEKRKRIRVIVKFVTEGDCNYELVQPYWISISGARDYQIKLGVR